MLSKYTIYIQLWDGKSLEKNRALFSDMMRNQNMPEKVSRLKITEIVVLFIHSKKV